MRIIYYCDWYEEYTANLASAVSAHESHDVTLIVREASREFKTRREDENYIHREIQRSGIDFHRLPGKYWSIGSLAAVFKIYRRKMKVGNHCFHLQQTGDPRFLWFAIRMPTVLTLHEPSARRGFNRQTNRLRALASGVTLRAYRYLADVIVVHTPGGLGRLKPAERRKAVVIPHGVEFRPLHPANDSKTILFFGRAAEYKGIDTLLAAMAEVWKVEPKARLRILASPGDYMCDTVLDCRVHATWNGYSNEELEQALSSARVVCLPYLSGSATGVGAKAYGSGKPIVASDLDGLRELVADENMLTQPESVVDLARALVAALSEDNRGQKVDPKRTWPGVAVAHINAYRALQGPDRKSRRLPN